MRTEPRAGSEIERAQFDVGAGDRVELSVSHEFRVDGLGAWVKVGVNLAVREGENSDVAIKRASRIIEQHIIKEIEKHGTQMAEANKAQR